MALAVLAEVVRAEGDREVGAELEDVADFDALSELHGLAAGDAGVALAGVSDLGDDVGRLVARHVDVADVPAGTVRPGHEVWRARHELVDDDDRISGPKW